jgi:hypothetical protein
MVDPASPANLFDLDTRIPCVADDDQPSIERCNSLCRVLGGFLTPDYR